MKISKALLGLAVTCAMGAACTATADSANATAVTNHFSGRDLTQSTYNSAGVVSFAKTVNATSYFNTTSRVSHGTYPYIGSTTQLSRFSDPTLGYVLPSVGQVMGLLCTRTYGSTDWVKVDFRTAKAGLVIGYLPTGDISTAFGNYESSVPTCT